MEFTITDFTVNKKCSNCGNCCSNLLPMTKGEVKRIKAYIKEHGIKEQRHNALNGFDMTCPFRDEANRKCLIYEIRPSICKSFMCNHKKEDIAKAKLDYHTKYDVVAMRAEFFGSKEEEKLFSEVFREMLW